MKLKIPNLFGKSSFRTGLFAIQSFFMLSCFQASAETVEKLLAGYLENDLQLKKYSVTAESKALDLKSAEINNGISVSLSTGEMKITTSKDKTRITVSPSVSASVPQANALSVSAEFPLTVEDGEKSVSNGKISATVGIISGDKKKRQVELLTAERELLEAKRNVQERAYSAEKEFYTNLKNLYNDAIAVLTAKASLYDDTTDLKVLIAQGYSKTSASYRQKNLEVQSDRRNVLEKQRIFERETSVFAKKCGLELQRIPDADLKTLEGWIKAGENAYASAISFLPSEIPVPKSENVFKYKKELYTETEQAVWNKYIGELKRDADYEMSLKLTGEYVFNDSFYSDTGLDSDGNLVDYGSDSVGGKLSLSWRGITASAGAYFPVGKTLIGDKSNDSTFNPYFALSLAIVPNEWRLAKISRQQDELDAKLEQIAIDSAAENYDTDLLDKVSTFHDLKWTQLSNKEEYETYNQLESDMAKWLKQGVVTENDYLDAENEKEKARINILINIVELTIFNDDVKLMFREDAKTEAKTESKSELKTEPNVEPAESPAIEWGEL